MSRVNLTSNESVRSIIWRYALALFLGLGSLSAWYNILLPVTSTVFIRSISLVYRTQSYTLVPSILSCFRAGLCPETPQIVVQGFLIGIIPACIASSAFYLLAVCNLATPMTLTTRIKSMVFLLVSLWLLNVARLFISTIILIQGGAKLFDTAHLLLWYVGSTLLVVLLWFLNVRLFEIRAKPIITDVKNLLQVVRRKK
jgi:exosortase/archaeosortase family protein